MLFPYDKPREVQDELMAQAFSAIKEKRSIVVHAPTGLGKTAAALAPALTYALENKLKVFFLTSRTTQHALAIQTLREIKDKHSVELKVTDVIGKKWMCAQGGVEELYSNEFAEFCRSLREGKKCEFYENMRDSGKQSVVAKKALGDLSMSISGTKEIISIAKDSGLCPYELTMSLAAKSDVIVADYYYVFHPDVSEAFLKKANIELKDTIIIVDEAHNLPQRLRNLATTRLSTFILKRAEKEARKFAPVSVIENVLALKSLLDALAKGMNSGDEKLIRKESFVDSIKAFGDYEAIHAGFESVAQSVRQQQRISFLGSMALFMRSWEDTDEGFAKYMSVKTGREGPELVLSNTCLDPSVISKAIFSQAHSSIVMSGTLTPTSMYRDLLGVANPGEGTYKSPFPKKNRLNLIVPLTTTKFTKRDDAQYKSIASICDTIINSVPGNSIIFYPSYYLRDEVFKHMAAKKRLFAEKQNLTKHEKEDLLEQFRQSKGAGSALLAVVSGSFGEGIDLPGDLLKAVVVVGLPLDKPDLETQELINYYDRKFGKGWDYGYLYPAFNKVLQNAGRCIRSETDKGVIVFLDERYIWPNYRRCFPPDWELEISKAFIGKITEFFTE